MQTKDFMLIFENGPVLGPFNYIFEVKDDNFIRACFSTKEARNKCNYDLMSHGVFYIRRISNGYLLRPVNAPSDASLDEYYKNYTEEYIE